MRDAVVSFWGIGFAACVLIGIVWMAWRRASEHRDPGGALFACLMFGLVFPFAVAAVPFLFGYMALVRALRRVVERRRSARLHQRDLDGYRPIVSAKEARRGPLDPVEEAELMADEILRREEQH